MSRIVLAHLLLAAPLLAQWGRDINPGMGPQLLRSVRDDLAAIVRAPAGRRAALIERFVELHGARRIEATKRFRNPELKALFLALLEHPDWQIQHRALLGLEHYGGADVLDAAWKRLDHPNRRLREKAAISCIKLWDGRGKARDIEQRISKERDFHVRRCLEALLRCAKGRTPERVHVEYIRTEPNGLMLVPFLSGMHTLAQEAPGYARRPELRQGGVSAGRPTTPRWTTPLLGQGDEEVAGTSLQPFANLRQGGRVYHTGLDVGASMDGAGYYAAAAGVVRLVSSGSDMGTLLVVQHHAGDGLVNAVYMHGGDTVFVKAGESVVCGQLLGTMGLSFSIENGGHFAHLHYGLYPGPFKVTHNYGYKPVEAGLADWYDPAKFLPRWIERTQPLVDELRPLHPQLRRAGQQIERGEFGSAYAAARRIRDGADPGSEIHADAVYLVGLLQSAPGNAVRRATKVRNQGYPRDALKQLKELGSRCRGVPGAGKVKDAEASWNADPLFKKALKGEGRFDSTKKRAARQKDRAKARALWQKLLDEYGDTVLRGRIEEQMR